jgi:hypothetical protein
MSSAAQTCHAGAWMVRPRPDTGRATAPAARLSSGFDTAQA